MIKALLRLFCWHSYKCKHADFCENCSGFEECPFYEPICEKCGKVKSDDSEYI